MNNTLSYLLKHQYWHPVKPPKDWEPNDVIQISEQIKKKYPDVPDPGDLDVQKLLAELKSRIIKKDWSKYYWEDLIKIALSFFDSSHLISEESEICDFLLKEIHHDGNFAYNLALFDLYIRKFNQNSELTKKLASAFDNNCDWTIGDHSKIRELKDEFDIFNRKKVPKLIAEYMISNQYPFSALIDKKIQAPHGKGLMQVVHELFVDKLKPKLAQGDLYSTKQLLSWIKPPEKDKPIEGENAAGLAIDALLSNWKDTEPRSEVKETIKNGLIDAYGDPRLNKQNVIAWEQCNKESKQILLKWLTGATIEMFFEIIAKSIDVNNRHMWINRKELWLHLHQNGEISEAWFCLSKDGEKEVEKIYRKTNDATMQEFAQNNSHDASDRKKCLLIMTVKDRIVVEGSHNFPTHIFPEGSMDIRLYQDSYNCREIRRVQDKPGHKNFNHYKNWRESVLKSLIQ